MQFPFPRYPFANNDSLEHTKKKKLLLRFHRHNKIHRAALNFPHHSRSFHGSIPSIHSNTLQILILQSASSIARGFSIISPHWTHSKQSQIVYTPARSIERKWEQIGSAPNSSGGNNAGPGVAMFQHGSLTWDRIFFDLRNETANWNSKYLEWLFSETVRGTGTGRSWDSATGHVWHLIVRFPSVLKNATKLQSDKDDTRESLPWGTRWYWIYISEKRCYPKVFLHSRPLVADLNPEFLKPGCPTRLSEIPAL